MLIPAPITVTLVNLYIMIPKPLQSLFRDMREPWDDLYGIDLLDQQGKNSSLVTAPGSNLQYHIIFGWIE